MSITNDVFKKAENGINGDAQNKADEEKAASRPKQKMFLIYILAALVGLYVGNVALGLFIGKEKKAIPADTKAKIVPVPQKIAQAPAQNPQEAKPKAGDKLKDLTSVISRYAKKEKEEEKKETFVLNGIFSSKSDRYALVNNQIVKDGDTVGSATVKRITEDEVELQTKDGTLKLSTQLR